MIVDGLWDVYNNYHMGVTAENVAKQYGVTRADQDAFALASQQKTEAAQKAGRFKDEILPLAIPQRKGAPLVFDTDEYPKHGSTLEALAGFEYNGGCWVFRAVGHRLAIATQAASTSFFLQLELNGVSRIGSNPLDLLKRSILGYVPTGGASRSGGPDDPNR